MLGRLLLPLSSRTSLLEQRHTTCLEDDPARHTTRGPRRSQAAGATRVACSETWHEEMNRRIERMSRQLSFDSITFGALAKYKSGWGHWSLFCSRRVQADGTRYGPWLSGKENEKDERMIIDYITYEGFFANDEKGWATSAVRSKVAAVRFMRTCNYYPDPVAGNPRIKASFKVLEQRIREPTQVKMPATKEVVCSAMKRVFCSKGYSDGDSEAVNAAIQSAWLFLLRSSEYCSTDGSPQDYCLRLGDVAFYEIEGRRLSFRDAHLAHTMSLALRGSKTDQRRRGCTRRLNRTGQGIDAVDAVASMLRARGDEWLRNPFRPLFELESGKAISRSQVSEALKLGATALGLDPRRYATHSLRRGGITAMAAAGIPTEVIRRWGRWLSDCWRRYVFGTAEELRNLSRTMVEVDYTLAMALEDFRVSVPHQYKGQSSFRTG